jgi:Ceramidase
VRGTDHPELWISAAALAASFAVLIGFAWAGWPGAPNHCLESFGCFCEAPRPGWVRQPANTFSNFGFIAVGLASAAAQGRERVRGALARGNPLGTGALIPSLGCVALTLLGPGSMFLHASLTGWGGQLDVLSMYLWVTFAIAYTALRTLRLGVNGFVTLYAGLFAGAAFSKLATPVSSDLVFGLLIGGFLAGEGAVWRHRRELQQRRGWLALAFGCFAAAFALWLPSRRPDGPLCDPHSLLQGHAAWHLLCAAAAGAIWLYWRSERPSPDAPSSPAGS